MAKHVMQRVTLSGQKIAAPGKTSKEIIRQKIPDFAMSSQDFFGIMFGFIAVEVIAAVGLSAILYSFINFSPLVWAGFLAGTIITAGLTALIVAVSSQAAAVNKYLEVFFKDGAEYSIDRRESLLALLRLPFRPHIIASSSYQTYTDERELAKAAEVSKSFYLKGYKYPRRGSSLNYWKSPTHTIHSDLIISRKGVEFVQSCEKNPLCAWDDMQKAVVEQHSLRDGNNPPNH